MVHVQMTEAALPRPRALYELIELATEREKTRGYAITLDEDFASDAKTL